jgi:choline-sulfatase
MMTERIGSIAVSKPNILLFMADQLNGQLCPINGDPVCHMPNLQRLAGQGVNFSQARCNDPLCTPSRMSMLTDWLVSNLGCAWDNASALRSDIPTFLHMLTRAGYRSALSGKKHSVVTTRFRLEEMNARREASTEEP